MRWPPRWDQRTKSLGICPPLSRITRSPNTAATDLLTRAYQSPELLGEIEDSRFSAAGEVYRLHIPAATVSTVAGKLEYAVREIIDKQVIAQTRGQFLRAIPPAPGR